MASGHQEGSTRHTTPQKHAKPGWQTAAQLCTPEAAPLPSLTGPSPAAAPFTPLPHLDTVQAVQLPRTKSRRLCFASPNPCSKLSAGHEASAAAQPSGQTSSSLLHQPSRNGAAVALQTEESARGTPAQAQSVKRRRSSARLQQPKLLEPPTNSSDDLPGPCEEGTPCKTRQSFLASPLTFNKYLRSVTSTVRAAPAHGDLQPVVTLGQLADARMKECLAEST